MNNSHNIWSDYAIKLSKMKSLFSNIDCKDLILLFEKGLKNNAQTKK